MDGKLAILGTGRMGEALLGGLLRSGWMRADQVWCADVSEQRLREIADTYGVAVTPDPAEVVEHCDVLLVAVKPQNLDTLLAQIAPGVHSGQTVISVVAGVRSATIEDALSGQIPVVRVMSNTPVQVDEAMSAVAAGRFADETHVGTAETILGHVGKVLRLPEPQLDAVTALSGSGPAYVFLVAEAMIEAGLSLGLDPDVAAQLVVQTMVGSAKMLRDAGHSPGALREAVSSPGGTTVEALGVLDERGVPDAFREAVRAAHRRSRELAGD